MGGDDLRWRLVAVAAAVAVAIGVLLWQTTLYPAPFTNDDAFISYRYARNAAQGHGLVFNLGERVEGYTNFLWVVLLALVARLGGSIPVTARALGIGFACATLVLVAVWPFRLSRASPGDRAPGTAVLWGCLAALLLGLSHPFAYNSLVGLETPLVAFLLTAALATAVGPTLRVGWLSAVLFLLAMLARPEAAAYFVTMVGLAAICALREGGSWRRALGTCRPAAAALLGYAVYVGWRLSYYGHLLPNTFTDKRAPLASDLASGWAYLSRYVAGGHGALVLAALLVLLAAGERRLALWAAPLLAVNGLAATVTGGDHMWLWRFFVPLIPLSAVVVARAVMVAPRVVGRLVQRRVGISMRTGVGWWRPATVAIATAVAGAVLLLPGLGDASTIAATYARYDRKWIFIGRALQSMVPPSATIALSPAGAIPYYSGLRTIDILGLTDAHIARVAVDPRVRRKGHQKHDGAYVLARAPDLLILGNGIIVARLGGPRGRLVWYPDLSVSPGLAVDRGAAQPWPETARVLTYEEDIFDNPEFERRYRPAVIPLSDGLELLVWRRTADPSPQR